MSTHPVGAVARWDSPEGDGDAARALAALPTRALPLLDAARESGARWAVGWGKDTGDNPFVSVEVSCPPDGLTGVKASWHTRDTGTLRLFSLLLRQPGRYWHDATLTKAIATLTAQEGAA